MMRRPARAIAELWVSRQVRDKLRRKHHLEIWEVEQAVFDDPDRLVLRAGDLYAVYGTTFPGRFLLCLVRQLSEEEIPEAGRDTSVMILRLVTARDMNEAQRRRYRVRKDRGV